MRIGVGGFRKYATALLGRYPYNPGDDCAKLRNDLSAKFDIIIRITLGIVKYQPPQRTKSIRPSRFRV